MKFFYPVSSKTQEQIDKTYTYHAPFGNQPERYDALRQDARNLALRIVGFTPPSREQSLALTHLETAVMYANKAIALEEKPEPVVRKTLLDEPDVSEHPHFGRA